MLSNVITWWYVLLINNVQLGGTTGVHPLRARQIVPSGLLRQHTAARSAGSTRAFPAHKCLDNPNIFKHLQVKSCKNQSNSCKIHENSMLFYCLVLGSLGYFCQMYRFRSSKRFHLLCTKKIENEAKPSGAQRLKQLQQNLDTYNQTNWLSAYVGYISI